MEQIRDVLLRVAADNEAHIKEQNGLYLLAARGDSGTVWQMFLHCAEDERLLLCYLLYPGVAPPAKEEEAVRLMAKLNFDLKFGTFEFGKDMGEIRLRVSQFFPPSLAGEEADDFLVQVMQITIQVAETFAQEITALLTAEGETGVSG